MVRFGQDALLDDVPDLIAPPFFLAALLLMLGGLAKVRFPDPASRALAAVRLPSRRAWVRLLGLTEIAVGGWAVATPGPGSAVALASLYAGFALFLMSLLRANVPDAGCGCAGSHDAPPSLLHVGLDLVAVAAGVAVALRPVPSLPPFLSAQPLEGLPLLVGMAGAGLALSVAVSRLPALTRETRRSAAVDHDHHRHDHPGRHVTMPRPAA